MLRLMELADQRFANSADNLFQETMAADDYRVWEFGIQLIFLSRGAQFDEYLLEKKVWSLDDMQSLCLVELRRGVALMSVSSRLEDWFQSKSPYLMLAACIYSAGAGSHYEERSKVVKHLKSEINSLLIQDEVIPRTCSYLRKKTELLRRLKKCTL